MKLRIYDFQNDTYFKRWRVKYQHTFSLFGILNIKFWRKLPLMDNSISWKTIDEFYSNYDAEKWIETTFKIHFDTIDEYLLEYSKVSNREKELRILEKKKKKDDLKKYKDSLTIEI